ncbi:MAG: hypothetical protein JWR88_761 [Pseudonocardia sp.]|nr:hypothetical protein [Pseudonocardia sp.]
MTDYVLHPVGHVESPLVDLAATPKQGYEGSPLAWLVFEGAVSEAARDIEVGTELVVLTWLDRADRDVQVVHPRGEPANPMRGVFSTRSPDRPNPVGVHRVQVVAVDGLRVQVRDLEAVDGTPIVDVKSVLAYPE